MNTLEALEYFRLKITNKLVGCSYRAGAVVALACANRLSTQLELFFEREFADSPRNRFFTQVMEEMTGALLTGAPSVFETAPALDVFTVFNDRIPSPEECQERQAPYAWAAGACLAATAGTLAIADSELSAQACGCALQIAAQFICDTAPAEGDIHPTPLIAEYYRQVRDLDELMRCPPDAFLACVEFVLVRARFERVFDYTAASCVSEEELLTWKGPRPG